MNKIIFFNLVALLLSGLFSQVGLAFTEIVNKEELRSRLGHLSAGDLSQVKIAVLDNGFGAFAPGKGMLPDSAELIEGPLKFPVSSSHGLGMAQIVWAMTGQNSQGPKFYLINSHGFTNFKAAVDFVVKNKIDIVLYSQIWLFGSNFDGKGFINKVVNQATEQGVIWINAAGNLGGHVYSGQVNAASKKLKLNNKLDENHFNITLTWNNFGESEQDCATKDLDLELLDSQQKVILSSSLIQQGQSPDLSDPSDRHSCYARESLSIKSLERGNYTIRVVSKSANFSLKDTFKVIITEARPESLEFTDSSVGLEIMPPADNLSVITVGDKSKLSSTGPTSDGRVKPDFVIEKSQVSFTNGNMTQGSSNAAAMVAGSVAILKSLNPNLSGPRLLTYAQSLRSQYVLPIGLRTPQYVPDWMQKYVPVGGIVKAHPITNRAIIFSSQDPTKLRLLERFNLRMLRLDDIVACDEYLSFCGVYARSQDAFIAPPLIEFRQFFMGQESSQPGIWKNDRVSFVQAGLL